MKRSQFSKWLLGADVVAALGSCVLAYLIRFNQLVFPAELDIPPFRPYLLLLPAVALLLMMMASLRIAAG